MRRRGRGCGKGGAEQLTQVSASPPLYCRHQESGQSHNDIAALKSKLACMMSFMCQCHRHAAHLMQQRLLLWKREHPGSKHTRVLQKLFVLRVRWQEPSCRHYKPRARQGSWTCKWQCIVVWSCGGAAIHKDVCTSCATACCASDVQMQRMTNGYRHQRRTLSSTMSNRSKALTGNCHRSLCKQRHWYLMPTGTRIAKLLDERRPT